MALTIRSVRTFMVAAAGTLVLGCSPLHEPQDVPQAPTSGWYSQQGARASFQPCGEAGLMLVGDADLRRRAHEFGLQDGDPVYVRLLGSRAGGQFHLDRVAQFGSQVPIRDCPMTGTSLQQAGGVD